MMIRVGIVGATGYTGAGLCRWLVRHPNVDVGFISSKTHAGEPISQIHPHLNQVADGVLVDLDEAVATEVDAVFCCQPHVAGMELVPTLLERGRRVIDLSADFRLDSPQEYEKWYENRHIAPSLLNEKVYGLPEINRERIKDAQLIGLPGCYPTSVILGLAPLLRANLIDPTTIIADCKSGVSGAGRKLSQRTHFVETNENLAPYNIGHSHRHVGEIEQELGKIAGRPARILFSPHLDPLNQGILSTIYVDLTADSTTDELLKIYHDQYHDEPFVRIRDSLPETAFVRETNFLDVIVQAVGDSNRAVVVSAEDNLVKGAFGQGIQCLNIMYGWPETTGLL